MTNFIDNSRLYRVSALNTQDHEAKNSIQID